MNKAELAKLIDKEAESGHWIWHGRMSVQGYPVAFFDGRSRQVARIVWERNTHTTLTHTCALHRLCSNERCVNPDHYAKEDVATPITPYKLEPGDRWRLRELQSHYQFTGKHYQ